MCFIAKDSKVSSRSPSYDSSVDDLLTDELEGLKKPSYSKLASLAKIQQRTLGKQEDLLIEETKKI